VHYNLGRGVPQDDVEGYAWALLAAASNQDARKFVLKLDSLLDNETRVRGISRAEQLKELIEMKKIRITIPPMKIGTITAPKDTER
jgi:hypothetical protein